jgi:hypothetical protein
MTQTQTNTAAGGPLPLKQRPRRPSNPREALIDLVARNPGKSGAELLGMFEEIARENQSYLSAIIEWWFVNAYRGLQKKQTATPDAAKQKQALKQTHLTEMRRTVSAHIERKARLILLDAVLPTGTVLRNATGAECARAGGWFQQIASAVKPNQIVGKVLSERDVQNLWKKA